MKRRILLYCLFLFIENIAVAQEGLKIGLTVGGLSTSLNIQMPYSDITLHGSGYDAGIQLSYGLNENVAFVFQPTYAFWGLEVLGENKFMNFYKVQGGIKLRIQSPFNWPSKLTIYGLPSINYFIKGYTHYYDLDEKVSLKGYVNPITLFLNFGLGIEHDYDWGIIQITGFYSNGMNDFAKNGFEFDGIKVAQNFETRLNGFSLNIGYLF